MCSSLKKNTKLLHAVLKYSKDDSRYKEDSIMKKVFLLYLILTASVFVHGISIEYKDLYGMVVPMSYDSLYLHGDAFGATDHVIRLNVPFDGGTTDFRMGISGQYELFTQSEIQNMHLDSSARLYFDLNSFSLRAAADTAEFKSYTLEIGEYPGFYFASASDSYIDITNSPTLDLSLSAGAGIGRLYLITPVLTAQLILKHLEVPPDRETVRLTAMNIIQRNQKLNPMTDNFAQLKLDYYQQRAENIGIPDRTAELILITESQEYRFELQRYSGLYYGWEIAAGLAVMPVLDLNPSNFDIRISPGIQAQFAGFIQENLIHYHAAGSLTTGYDSFTADNFFIMLNAQGNFRYLPPDSRWWIDSFVSTNIGYEDGFVFDLSLRGNIQYLINPNFTVYGGLGIDFSRLLSYAGGSIRIW